MSYSVTPRESGIVTLLVVILSASLRYAEEYGVLAVKYARLIHRNLGYYLQSVEQPVSSGWRGWRGYCDGLPCLLGRSYGKERLELCRESE